MNNKLKVIIIVLFAAYTSQHASAQRVLSWSSQVSHEAKLNVADMASDEDHVFITGTFSDSLFLAGNMLKTSGQESIYLAKLDNDGKFVWARQTGGNGNDQASAILAMGKNIFLAGLISDTLNTAEKKKHTNTKLFVSAWATEGEKEWMLKFEYEGRASLDMLESGTDNTIIAGGMFQGKINIDGAQYNSRLSTSAFVVILSTGGEVLHAFATGGNGNHRAIAACHDLQGNLFLMLATTHGSLILPANGKDVEYRFSSNGLLLAKFNHTYLTQWAIPLSGSGYIEGIKLLCDPSDNVYAGINFNRKINVGHTGFKSASQLATAILCFDQYGKLFNHNLIDNLEYCRLNDMALINGKELLLTGYYHGGFLFMEHEPEPDEKRRSAFIVQLDTDAQVVWYDDLHFSNDQSGRGLGFNMQGDILMAGEFRQHQDISTKSSVTEKSQSGVFVNRYHVCRPLNLQASAPQYMCPGDTVIISATPGFESYAWNDISGQGNTHAITEPGTYIIQAFDKYGCHGADTIIIGAYPLTKTYLGGEFTLGPGEYLEFTADSSYTDYAWSDNFPGRRRLISHNKNTGRLELTLYAKADGHCPVCDTLIINFTGMEKAYGLKVYPNPVSDVLYWSWAGSEQELYDITLLDSRGAIMYQRRVSETGSYSEGQINFGALNAGTYILKLNTATGFYNRLIVKQ